MVGLLVVGFMVMLFLKHKRGALNVDELIDWIQSVQVKGASDEQLRRSLVLSEWTEKEINLAFKKVRR